MNEVLNAIEQRRSVRGYEDRALTQEQIDALVKAALESPSARNAQPWHFSFVTDQALLAQINAEILKNSGLTDREIFYGAPLCVFLSADRENSWGPVDCGIAVENLALAAHGLGLGSVILGMPRAAFAGQRRAEFEQALKIPQTHDFVVAIAIGVPAMSKEAREVFPGKVDFVR